MLNQKSMVYEVDGDFDLGEWNADLNGESLPAHRPTPASIKQLLSVPARKSPKTPKPHVYNITIVDTI